jgi:membrane fusion protein (multidrug efflux system)
VSPGAYLRKGDVIAEIAAVDHVKIRFDAPERYLGDLRRGATVTVRTPVDPLYEREGTIEVVNPILDEATRSAQVVARIPNRDHRLRPGQSVDVSAVLSVRESAITIPDEAIFAEGDRSYVFVAKDDGTVARVAVETGARLADRVEIRSGLAAGSRVVTAGHQKLFDGAKVVPVGPGPPAGAGPAQGGPEPAAAGAPE